ncbi:SMC-Scp complex subunit ScpB [Methylocapsa acidiphila]|uniref:SMC-Scp complex subunit ScpB n=1 Tax=Methylocapsa acidiphila TaxID=133552 RepID=UPI0004025746|nr:SMC-Scp complex subunit ScpB [Methylocapsa acidiphila]
MVRRAKREAAFDAELADLPSELRWRTWMGRVEAVIFASAEPVAREMLARLVGRACNLDLIIADISDELSGRPYELASVAGGWRLQTRKGFADAIRAASGISEEGKALSQAEALVLAAIAYYQPIARAELSEFFGKEVSRDLIGRLRAQNFIAPGPRSPRPGAPYALVTTKTFLAQFGFESLRDLPDMEALEDAGLLAKENLLAGDFPSGFAAAGDADEGDDRPEADETAVDGTDA